MAATKVLALFAGRVAPFGRGERSAIVKSRIAGPVRIGLLGIEGDEQADLAHHGGPDKALHHYPFDHYARWRRLAARAELSSPGAFGENIATTGLCEGDVCIGDRYRLGNVLLEVSQGRQPCWKQAQRLDWPKLPALMVKERRSGWYYRVIEAGWAQGGDAVELVERSQPEWSVERVFGLLVAGEFRQDRAALKALAEMPQLFPGWRQRAVDLMGA